MDDHGWLSSLLSALGRLENSRQDGIACRWALGFFQRKNPYELPPRLPPRGQALIELETGLPDQIDPQIQSLFFNLPRELRDTVYPMLFEGVTVHVERVDGRLRTRYLDDLRDCCRCDEEKTRCMVKRTFQPLAGLMSPLKSCRKFYIEAINAVYPNLTFAFQDIMSLCYFLGGTPSHSLHVIQTLQLSFALVALPGYRVQDPHHEYYNAWRFASHTIKEIPNLREFQIVDGDEYYADETCADRTVYLADAEGYVPILGWAEQGTDWRSANRHTIPLKLVSG